MTEAVRFEPTIPDKLSVNSDMTVREALLLAICIGDYYFIDCIDDR